MILADTSLWIRHFRLGTEDFARLLADQKIATHPVVVGELVVGNLPARPQTLARLRRTPRSKSGSAEECLAFIENHKLYGRGLGWNDVQLLVAARLSGNSLWSLDVRLAAAAGELGVGYQPL